MCVVYSLKIHLGRKSKEKYVYENNVCKLSFVCLLGKQSTIGAIVMQFAVSEKNK
jgi:hypothetical protein